jgi:hypothetical protein
MQPNPLALIVEALLELVAEIVRGILWILGLRPQQRARRRAAAQARADERASREQLRQWREEAARQMFDGTAGFADEAEARSAMSARGGRKSPLDGRKFK